MLVRNLDNLVTKIKVGKLIGKLEPDEGLNSVTALFKDHIYNSLKLKTREASLKKRLNCEYDIYRPSNSIKTTII